MGVAVMSFGLHPEPEDEVERVQWRGETYRRRKTAPNTISCLFGEFTLTRHVYECLEPGERCIIPFELECGIVAGLATPALAERVGCWSADVEQRQIREMLQQDHQVGWSVTSLRKVTKAVSDGVVEPGRLTRRERVVALLEEAEESKGKHRPTLACGRDGVMTPIRKKNPEVKAEVPAKIVPKSSKKKRSSKQKKESGYQEASTGTLSVHDRRGKRLGTIYYGQMPEKRQVGLSTQLQVAIAFILTTIHDRDLPCPRLSYVTDAGKNQRNFYHQILEKLKNPWHAEKKLNWDWTVDFYHACTSLGLMAESLFADPKKGLKWYRLMRHWLRHRKRGVSEVLRSATQNENRRTLTKARRKAFRKAYLYLRRHRKYMNYAERAKLKLPIGSGVTEAACKTVFTERMKRSGMTWKIEGGQTILELRVLVLSKVWDQSYRASLRNQTVPTKLSYASKRSKTTAKAA